MDIARAKELLTALANGIDPFTGIFVIILISFVLCIRYLVRHRKSKKAPVRPIQANLGHRQNKTNWWMNFILE